MLIRHRIRYILIIPVGMAALFTLGMIIFPMYENGPDFLTFYKNQPNVLIVQPGKTTSESSIVLKTPETEKELRTDSYSKNKLQNATNITIKVISREKNDNTQTILLLAEGTSIAISPQSQVQFFAKYPHISIEVQQGKAKVSPSNNYSPRQLFLSGIDMASGKNTYQNIFETEKTNFIKNQVNPIFLQHTTLKKINKTILDIAVKLRPSTFTKNKNNFQAFEAYIPTTSQRTTETTIDTELNNEIKNQVTRGREETTLYQRRKKIWK